jgi:predicted nuclease with TOPRIM domain
LQENQAYKENNTALQSQIEDQSNTIEKVQSEKEQLELSSKEMLTKADELAARQHQLELTV